MRVVRCTSSLHVLRLEINAALVKGIVGLVAATTVRVGGFYMVAGEILVGVVIVVTWAKVF